MDTKIGTIAALTFISLLMVSSSCNKNWNCTEVIYNFECRLQIYPDDDSIKINDTIWLDMNVPKKLKDYISGEEIDYSQAENFGSAIRFVELIDGTIPELGVKPAVDSFEFKLAIGQQIPSILPKQVNQYIFQELQNTYNFKLGIIAKKKGIYGIGIGNAANVFRRNDKCTKANFSIKLINTNNHIYYLEQSRPGYVPSALEISNTYYFKVK
jgi:hypothetical protein